jgi:CubicO group peptidase (beta-lactamase class C family)
MKRLLSIPLFIILCSCLQINDSRNALPVSGNADTAQVGLVNRTLKMFPANTEFSIAIIKNGVVQYFGVRREADNLVTVVNHDRVFEIGSISKVFTSTLLAELVTTGKLSLDNDIGTGLDLTLKDNAKIAFSQLANHTSGLPRLPTNLNLFGVDPANPYRDYDELKLREYLANDLKTTQAPGTKYEYSNLAAGLLGYIITRIDKKSYEEVLQEKILKKYGMSSSTTIRSNIQDKLVKGRNPFGNEVPNWDLNVLVGAGGILSSAEDLSKFALAQFDDANAAMKLTRKETFKVNETMSMGLGWHIIRRDGKEYFNHNGGTGGYRSSMTIDSKSKNGVIILSNVSAFHQQSGKIDVLCTALMKTVE